MLGISDHVGKRGSIQGEIWVDGKLLTRTPIIRRGEEPWPINVTIPKGSKEIRIIATDAGDGYGHDHAIWAQAGFCPN